MKLVNLTPHAIRIINDDRPTMVIAPSGTVARVDTTTHVVSTVEGIDILSTKFGVVINLPKSVDGTLYIASRLVVEVAGRTDIVCPGELVRDEEGNIVGCKNLSY